MSAGDAHVLRSSATPPLSALGPPRLNLEALRRPWTMAKFSESLADVSANAAVTPSSTYYGSSIFTYCDVPAPERCVRSRVITHSIAVVVKH